VGLFILLPLVLADELAPVVKIYAWQTILVAGDHELDHPRPADRVAAVQPVRGGGDARRHHITYTTIPIYAAMKAIDPSMFEAAVDLGQDGGHRRGRSDPLAAPGIFIAMILVYIPMLTDFVGGHRGRTART
jgi:spermidine/putrescine transport system permease protein